MKKNLLEEISANLKKVSDDKEEQLKEADLHHMLHQIRYADE